MSKHKAEFEHVEAVQHTDSALLCSINDILHWIPKSQIDDDSEVWKVGDIGTLILPEWLAIQKGLV